MNIELPQLFVEKVPVVVPVEFEIPPELISSKCSEWLLANDQPEGIT